MAKLALLTFTLVILNSTVRINADFQLITVLYKLIESVEQLNSSISKINGRLDKLEDTIPTRPEHIIPDPEPKRVDEKVKKAFESEKVFIRKSLSVCEKKFHVFEAQVNRHLSSMYTAIESNKDKVDEQIQLINESLDRKSDALHVQQEIRRINATFEQLYNNLSCSYSPGTFQLYNGNTELNIAEHNSMVEVKCKNGHNYELKNTETDQYIDSFNAKCLFGQLDKDLSVLKCLPKRCINENTKIALYTGDRNTRVVTHTSKVHVKCTDDGYEMKNTQTVKYESNLTTTCTFGKFDYQISHLTCLPRRPDVKYSVYLKTSESRGQGVKVNVRIVGNGQTAEFQLNGVYNDRISNDLYFTGTDVRPIQSVVVSKDRAIRRDDDLSIEYVFLYIEESEEYYVFTGTSLHTNLTDSHPLTLTLSDHPEKCSSHTYGKALERTPHNLRSRRYVGRITLHECKIRCITTHSVKCKSVFHRPRGGLGHCYLIEHSPDDDRYFRDNNSGETNMGFVSYGRICKTT